jgi:hypothetical protein
MIIKLIGKKQRGAGMNFLNFLIITLAIVFGKTDKTVVNDMCESYVGSKKYWNPAL